MNGAWRETFRIGADHPSLPGHFPGRPVVPGVVLLDRVAAALERWRGQGIAALAQVKFAAPLLPDEDAVLTLDAAGTRLRFRVMSGDVLIASGDIEPA